MFIHRSFYLLIVLVLLSTACAPQTSIESTATPSRMATSLPSLLPTLTARETATELPNPFGGNKAWIAYQTNRTGEGIWLIHPDGTEDHQIAKDFQGHWQLPDWSPDGRKIVMTPRDTGGTEPLYEYDLGTETYRQLFPCEAPCLGDDEPAYSPNGTKVVFIRALGPFVHSDAANDDVPSDCGLWIGEIASGKVTQITSNHQCDREYNPRWSPDGSKLVYWHDPYSNGQPTGTSIYVINADGSNEHQLTNIGDVFGEADWSPDGQWIVFDTHPLEEYNFVPAISNLYRMHPDGSGREQLTHYETSDLRATQPQYTPDGKWIIFTAVTPYSRCLWVIPSEGGEPIVLTKGGIYTHGTWQP